MEKIATENLFLLEFLVDKVRLDPELTQEIGAITGNTCVSVQFLDNSTLDICEDDFTPKGDLAKENENLKSGKSCLFSLTPEQADEAVRQFDINVNIFKKMQPEVLPDKIQVGNSLVSIVDLFNELIESLATPAPGQSPTAKTLKDTFKITNPSGQSIGDISMYIRMSCFGKLIVTQFQMNLEDKSVLFKDKEGHSLYRYKKVGKAGDANSPDGGGGKDGSCLTSCPSVPCPTSSFEQKLPPCNECSLTPQEEENDTLGNYKEIGAEVGGNSLIIRILKNKKPEEPDDSCCCTAGNLGEKKRPKLSAISNDGPMSDFTSTQCCGQNNAATQSAACSGGDGMAQVDDDDPNHDVFVLRIGKKSEGTDKQGELEVEVRTPKGPPLKQLPKKETVETQCEDDGSGKKGKKGKKGGKGGKKGGKKKK